jgi:hypothetical protein
VSSDAKGVTLWVVEIDGPPVHVDISGTAVRVEFVSEQDPMVEVIAAEAVPLRRASWVLARRRH